MPIKALSKGPMATTMIASSTSVSLDTPGKSCVATGKRNHDSDVISEGMSEREGGSWKE